VGGGGGGVFNEEQPRTLQVVVGAAQKKKWARATLRGSVQVSNGGGGGGWRDMLLHDTGWGHVHTTSMTEKEAAPDGALAPMAVQMAREGTRQGTMATPS
jgi:hypothetical protein